MRVAIPAIFMVGLFAASCGGSSPTPAPVAQVPPAEAEPATGAPTEAAPAAASPPAEAKPNAYKSDLEAWCNAPVRAPGAATTADPSARARLIAEWIDKQLQTDEARALATRMGTLGPADRPAAFRKELDAQGIKSCPFEDEMSKRR